MPSPSPCGRPRRPPGLIWATASRCAATTRRGSRTRPSQMWEFECPAPTTIEPPLWPPALVFSTRWAPVRAARLSSWRTRRDGARVGRREFARLRLPGHWSESWLCQPVSFGNF
eukprot:2731368-Prymnesium_polylepis.1